MFCAMASTHMMPPHRCRYAPICSGIIVPTIRTIIVVVVEIVWDMWHAQVISAAEWMKLRHGIAAVLLYITIISSRRPAWKVIAEAVTQHNSEESTAQASYDATQQPNHCNVAQGSAIEVKFHRTHDIMSKSLQVAYLIDRDPDLRGGEARLQSSPRMHIRTIALCIYKAVGLLTCYSGKL